YFNEGRGGAAHAVFHGVPAAVLLSDDGRDGGHQAGGRGGDGDAGGQHHVGGGVDHADRAGGGAAVRGAGGRPDGGRRGRRQDSRVVWVRPRREPDLRVEEIEDASRHHHPGLHRVQAPQLHHHEEQEKHSGSG